MLRSGRVDFGEMKTVVFGRPAAEIVAEEARRREVERVFLMASGTLNRTTDEVAKIRGALGVAVGRYSRGRSLCRGHLLRRGQSLCRCAGIARLGTALPRVAAG